MAGRRKKPTRIGRTMPRRNEQNYMLVKTHEGYVKVDKDGNKFPVDKKKPEIKKNKKKS